VILLFAGCIDVTKYAESPAITSEVDDWRDEIIYQVLVDRFANGDVNNDWNVTENDETLSKYMGGDYQGVIDHVDYLEALGVTTIWVSPIVVNVESDAGVASYHGYWTQNFKGVNPHFGDIAKFRELVDVMHTHGIKVILDIVTNHVGQLFYYDINRNGQPDTTVYGAGSRDPTNTTDPIQIITEWDPQYDARGVQGWTSLGESGPAPLGWVYMPEINRMPPEPAEFQNDTWYNRRGRVTNWNDFDQVVHGDFPGGLKDLDTSNPDVQAALIDVFQYWIRETNIDGYRIDTVKHVEHGFWQQFCTAMRDECADLGKDRFMMFGEIFDGDDALIGSYTAKDELDSTFYFSQKFQVFDDVFKHGAATKKIEDLYNLRATNYGTAPQEGGIGVAPHDALVNFMDNHDVPRFLYGEADDAALRLALAFLFTEDGVPCLYYGTEQGFAGGNDPANREPLWWSDYRTDGPLFQYTATLTRLRKAYAALRRGDFAIKWASDRTTGEDAYVLAFERSVDDSRALVVMNTGKAGPAHTGFGSSAMPVGFAPGTELAVAFPPGDDRTWTVSGSGALDVEVQPQSVLVLVPKGEIVALDGE
jgi:alpha-amylase